MSVAKIVKPASAGLIHLTVLRTERLSQGWMRVTLGGGEIDDFTPVGERGIDRDHVSFTGYWRLGAASPASRASRATASRPA